MTYPCDSIDLQTEKNIYFILLNGLDCDWYDPGQQQDHIHLFCSRSVLSILSKLIVNKIDMKPIIIHKLTY